MQKISSEAPFSPLYPIRVFALVMLTVTVVEGSIMVWLPYAPDALRRPLPAGVMDTLILVVFTAPVIWFLAVLPLRNLFEARGRLLQRVFETQEQERERIARDLHDGIGQHLTALLVALRTIEESPDLQTARDRARQFRELGATAHEEVRRLVRGLHPMALEELGLRPAVERLCDEFRRSPKTKVMLRCELPDRRMEPAVESAIFRVLQEALTNASRHAEASEIEIWLSQDVRSVILVVSDNGKGIDKSAVELMKTEKGSFGLGSMRERILALHGEFSLRSDSMKGTMIEAWIPITR